MKFIILSLFVIGLTAALPVFEEIDSNSTVILSASHGVDLTGNVMQNSWKCLQQNGINFGIVRAFHSTGTVDSDAPHCLYNAYDAGMQNMNVYHFPCRSKDAAGQVNTAVNYLKGFEPYPGPNKAGYTTMWIDVETNPSSSCTWNGHSAASNCQFIGEMVAAIEKAGKRAGVYTSKYMWDQIAGSGCTSASHVPLWYPHYDNMASCSDFSSFGGWKSAQFKQYAGDASLCGLDVDRNIAC